jgi:hypothetical protein
VLLNYYSAFKFDKYDIDLSFFVYRACSKITAKDSTMTTLESFDKNTNEEPICIYIPEIIPPDDRERFLERPLANMLPLHIARVDGGGTWLYGATDIWIYTSDIDLTLPTIRCFLLDLPIPDCTQIQYRRGEADFHDLFINGEWQCAIPANGNHLGFSVAA